MSEPSFCSFSAFCSFCTSQDDAAPTSGGSLWHVRALFRVVGTDGLVCQPATKCWASPGAPAVGSPDALWPPMASNACSPNSRARYNWVKARRHDPTPPHKLVRGAHMHRCPEQILLQKAKDMLFGEAQTIPLQEPVPTGPDYQA